MWDGVPTLVMLRQNVVYSKAACSDTLHDSRIPHATPCMCPYKINSKPRLLRPETMCIAKTAGLDILRYSGTLRPGRVEAVADGNQGELSDEDDDLCPVDCVREFKTNEEFLRILEKSKGTDSLVVVDFYRTSCGSCKYIEQGFAKLCKGSGDQEAAVIFLKHNVIDEYDEQSEVAEQLRIKTVPLFHFYKDGVLLEAFPTRDKERIDEAILKYMSSPSQDT